MQGFSKRRPLHHQGINARDITTTFNAWAIDADRLVLIKSPLKLDTKKTGRDKFHDYPKQ